MKEKDPNKLKSLVDKILEVNKCDAEWESAEDFHMTLPYERARSINFTRTLLKNMLFNNESNDVITDETMELIKHALRHYPTEYDVIMMANKCPDILFVADEID